MPLTITIKNIVDDNNVAYVWSYDESINTATLIHDPAKEPCNDPQKLIDKFKAILCQNTKFDSKHLLLINNQICLLYVKELGYGESNNFASVAYIAKNPLEPNNQGGTDYNDGITISGITLFRQGELYVLPPTTPLPIRMYAVEKMTAYLYEIDNLIPAPYRFILQEFSQHNSEQFFIRQAAMTMLQQMWEELLPVLLPLALSGGNYLPLQQWRNEAVEKIQAIISEYEQLAMQTSEANFVAGKALADGIIYRGRQANGNFILMPARIYLGQNELNYDPAIKAYKIPSDSCCKIGSDNQIASSELIERLSLAVERMAYSDSVAAIDLIKPVLEDGVNTMQKHSAISSLFLLLAYSKINKLAPKKYSIDLSGYPDYSNVVVYAWSTFKGAALFWLFDRESPEVMQCYLPSRYSTEDIESIFSDLLDIPGSDIFKALLDAEQKEKLKQSLSLQLLDSNYVQIEQRKLTLSTKLLTTIDAIYQGSLNAKNSSVTKFFTDAAAPAVLGKRKNKCTEVKHNAAAMRKYIKR